MIGKSVGSIVSDKQIQELIAVPASATVSEAVSRMSEKGVGAVLIMNSQNTVDGIFTERDLMIRVVNEGRGCQDHSNRDGHDLAGRAGGRVDQHRGCVEPDGGSRISALAGRGRVQDQRYRFDTRSHGFDGDPRYANGARGACTGYARPRRGSAASRRERKTEGRPRAVAQGCRSAATEQRPAL